MNRVVPKAVHVTAIAAIVAASALLLSAAAQAADRKPTRSQQAQWGCSYWKPIDTERYKECVKRNR